MTVGALVGRRTAPRARCQSACRGGCSTRSGRDGLRLLWCVGGRGTVVVRGGRVGWCNRRTAAAMNEAVPGGNSVAGAGPCALGRVSRASFYMHPPSNARQNVAPGMPFRSSPHTPRLAANSGSSGVEKVRAQRSEPFYRNRDRDVKPTRALSNGSEFSRMSEGGPVPP